ncbi:MAG: chemotaxis protein CheD [Gemmatimonadota bacterium]
MTSAVGAATATTLLVGMGESRLAGRAALLRTVGLGSCLAVIIFAPGQQLAALAHCLLPTRPDDDPDPARYVDSAIPHLLATLRAAGAREPFAATLVGGASMFPGLTTGVARDIAADNVAAARAVLSNSAVPIRSEDVGGHVGRSVVADPVTQRVLVHTIREGDRCL